MESLLTDAVTLPSSPAPAPVWRWRLLAALLILAAGGLRVAYFTSSCPLDLAPDEAHYWDWSRHLDWSYYSKGPLVAYLIHAGCAVGGPWAEHLAGNEMAAVRLPAVLCGSLLLVSLYILTVQVFRDERLALAVVALSLTLPVISAGASIMTIDAPYTCCWGWALVLGYQAVWRRSAWAWPVAGLVIGLGILAKYTMVLWVPSLGFFLLTAPTHRRLLLQPGFWIMTGIAVVCCFPILVWNTQHGWVSLWHVTRLAGLRATSSGTHHLYWEGPLAYLGTQAGLLLGFWFVAWTAAMIAHRPGREGGTPLGYLWWMSAPMFVLFLLFSPKTNGGEPNWPVTAYLSGMVLTAGWLRRQLQSPCVWYRWLTTASVLTACVLGLALTAAMHHSEWLYPVLTRCLGGPSATQPFPLRRYDPTCRLRGWRTLASEVDHLRAELGQEGVVPALAGTGWALPGELGFYCAGHPEVYSIGRPLGDRRSQYDLWHPNPVADRGRFLGRTFIVVGACDPILAKAFDHVEPPHVVIHYEQGQPVACWPVVVCRGFRGFPPLPPDDEY